MIVLCWPILLLCLSASAENIALYRESGESVTLECSSAGCLSSNEEYVGMYLYQVFKKMEEVLYYHSMLGLSDKITPRKRYKNRIQTSGSLKNHTIAISNLTVDDAGFYSCVYLKLPRGKVKCNVYTLVIRGVHCVPATEKIKDKSPPLVLVILVTCTISTLVTMVFILLILRVKKWTSTRREKLALQVSSDNVYEVMTKNSFHHQAAP